MSDDIFEEFINGLNFSLSNKGLKSPDIEDIEDDEGTIEGQVLKLSFSVNMFMNHNQKKYFMLTTDQKMQNLGSMSLKDAIVKFNSKQRRKKS